METITIEEFKKLKTRKDTKQPFGLFAISEKAQKHQCENLKVGETVFFLHSADAGIGEDGRPQIDIVIKQATLVEAV